jgi:hypothetical protein
MKRAIVAAFVLLTSGAAGAADFDIDAYCHMVSKEASDRDAAENACREQEKRDRDKLAGTSIPSGIDRHCSQVAQAAGGSYRVMQTCVQQELANQEEDD